MPYPKLINVSEKLAEYTEKVSDRNSKDPLKNALHQARYKIMGNQKKYNDDSRYLIVNALCDLKKEKNVSFNITEKQYLIDNKVVVPSSKGVDENIFRFNTEYYKPNLNIKPTIQKEFQQLMNSQKPVENFKQYIHENFRHDCSIYDADGGTSFSSVHRAYDILGKKGVLWWGYETGGADGGNCWGGDAREYSVNDIPKKEFPALKSFLKETVPNITFLEYDDLKDIIQSDEVMEREYYGNHTTYHVEHIKPEKLYKKLNDMGYDMESRFSNKEKKKSGLKIENN